ncbi:MAG: hypothetical protein M3068_09465 [Gemmatimonadota bacterium]|nr:hypothetical protein [Gemmatimonadota bacterium]
MISVLCRWASGSLAVGLALSLAPASARSQEYTRFAVDSVVDSTFRFTLGGQRWVVPGQRGIAVDPRRRDALIARFRVLRVVRDTATALVTGQTARISTDLAALIERPQIPFYRRGLFWAGTIAGASVGAIIGARAH